MIRTFVNPDLTAVQGAGFYELRAKQGGVFELDTDGDSLLIKRIEAEMARTPNSGWTERVPSEDVA